METKICKDCSIEKSLNCFYKKSGRENEWNSYCKECHLTRTNKSRNKNPNTKTRAAKNWQNWYVDNKQNKINYNTSYVKERLKKDPNFKMRMYVSNRIRVAFTKLKGSKQDSIWEKLPYTPEQLKEHLEKQFEPWMNWDNYGNGIGCWNIDHVLPQSCLPFNSLEDVNFLKCWSLDNLRPLSSIENIKKSNKIL